VEQPWQVDDVESEVVDSTPRYLRQWKEEGAETGGGPVDPAEMAVQGVRDRLDVHDGERYNMVMSQLDAVLAELAIAKDMADVVRELQPVGDVVDSLRLSIQRAAAAMLQHQHLGVDG